MEREPFCDSLYTVSRGRLAEKEILNKIALTFPQRKILVVTALQLRGAKYLLKSNSVARAGNITEKPSRPGEEGGGVMPRPADRL